MIVKPNNFVVIEPYDEGTAIHFMQNLNKNLFNLNLSVRDYF